MLNFCVRPWYSKEIRNPTNSNADHFCCWIKGKSDRIGTQQRFINEEAIPECKKCWDAEAKGEKSRRIQSNDFLDHALNLSVANLELMALRTGGSHLIYQIALTNVCNGSCITCGSRHSSAWAKLERDAGLQPYKTFEYTVDAIDAVIDFKTAKSIELVGGEPFLSDQTWWIIDQLIEHDNTDCLVSIVTNGTIALDKHVDRLKQCSNLNICLSIDGIGPVFEYLRYPLKWETLKNNIEHYRSIAKELLVSYTESNLNAAYTYETTTWLDEQDLPYIINRVHYPQWFAPEVKPGHPLWEKFLDEVARQDAMKGISYKDYINIG